MGAKPIVTYTIEYIAEVYLIETCSIMHRSQYLLDGFAIFVMKCKQPLVILGAAFLWGGGCSDAKRRETLSAVLISVSGLWPLLSFDRQF